MLNQYRLETVRTQNELIKKREEWILFEKEVLDLNINCTYDYIYFFWNHFKDCNIRELKGAKELLIIFMYKNNLLIAIFPLLKITKRKKKIFNVIQIEFIGQQLFSNYFDIISTTFKEVDYNYFLKWLNANEKYDIINLSHIPEFSNNINSIFKDNLYPFSHSSELRLNENETYDLYKQNIYPKNYKKNFNKLYNRLNKANISYTLISKKFEIIDLEELKRISENKILQGKTNVYNDLFKRSFLEEIFIFYNATIYFLKLSEKNVSFVILLFYKNQVIWYDTSYDASYEKFWPGTLIKDLLLEECFKKNYKHNLLGWGQDFHKYRFCNKFVKLNLYIHKGNRLLSFIWFNQKKKQYRKASTNFLLNDELLSLSKHNL